MCTPNMAESAGDTVSLLVCLGERKRPISLSRGATFNELRLEIVEEFRDVFGIYTCPRKH